MKQLILGVSALFMMSHIALAQDTVTVDSSYNNWYYASRQKLYEGLNNRKYSLVFFGNSITERGNWQELIGRQYQVGNRGIGGDNTFGMKARILSAIASKPKKIFLMMGINDIGRGLSEELVAKNCEHIIRLIQKHSPQTEIYVQSTLPLNEEKLKYDYLFKKEARILSHNALLKRLCQQYQLTFVDLTQVLGEGTQLKAQFTDDGIHVNKEGYQVWVDYLKQQRYL